MTLHLRGWIVATTGLVLAMGLLTGRPSPSAAQDKAMVAGILKLADAIKKKDAKQVKMLSKSLASKYELEDLMPLFRPRTRKGIGVGTKPAAVEPDGIERKLVALAKTPLDAKQVGDEGAALTHMGYVTAALAKVTEAHAPKRDQGKKKVKDWLAWSVEMEKAGLGIVEGVKKKDGAAITKAALKADRSRLGSSCDNCHEVFME